MEDLKDFIISKINELENRIYRILDKYLGEGLFGKIILTLNNIFVGSIAKEYNVIRKIIKKINEYEDEAPFNIS